MDQRHASVLIELVEEYVRTARPVGSSQLLERLGWDVSPATIRHMLHELDEAGYVLQPHTSAGRVPTDRGYRFYVDQVRVRAANVARRRALDAQLQQAEQHYQQLARAVSKVLARLSQSVAVSGFFPDGTIQETGLHELLKQPEAEDSSTVQEVSRILEHVDEHLSDLSEPERGVIVYIGRENPYVSARHTSVMVRAVTLPDARVAVLTLVGPKRMPYQRNMVLLEDVAAALHNHSL